MLGIAGSIVCIRIRIPKVIGKMQGAHIIVGYMSLAHEDMHEWG